MQARTLAREQSLLNTQLRAFGTTIRYAVAGTAVFGVAGTISSLAQIQTQLGQISALSGISGIKGPGGGSIQLVGSALQDMSQQVRQASIDTVQPISSINEAILNLMSTSQGLKSNEIVPIIEEMAKGATLAQTPIENLTQAAASMNIAFQKAPSLENFRKFSREWFTVIGLAPGARAAAPQVIQQLGPLASIARGSRFNQEQLMTMVLGALRFGGSPSTSLRGVQYLMQGLASPPSKQAAEALAQAGVTPTFTAQHGGWAALMRVLNFVSKLGPSPGASQLKQLSNISDEDLDTMGKLPPALASGPAMEWLRKATGRVHAQRAAIILAAQLQQHGDVLSLMQDFNKIADKQGDQTDAYIKGWQRFLNEAKLPQAAVALQVLGQDVATAMEPILNLGATGITGLSKLATKHQDVTRGLVIAGGLAALFSTGRRALGTLGGAAGRAGGAVVVAESLAGAEGQWKGMPGESATRPAFVWIVGSGLKFGTPSPVPVGGTGGGGTTTAEEGGRLRGLLRSTLKYSLVGLAAYEGAKVVNPLLDKLPHWGDTPEQKRKKMMDSGTIDLGKDLLYNPKHGFYKYSSAFGVSLGVSEKYVAKQLDMTLAQLEKKIHPGQVVGKASVDVNVNMKDANGNVTRKKTGVTMDLFPDLQDSPLRAPSSRGQGKVSRG